MFHLTVYTLSKGSNPEARKTEEGAVEEHGLLAWIAPGLGALAFLPSLALRDVIIYGSVSLFYIQKLKLGRSFRYRVSAEKLNLS